MLSLLLIFLIISFKINQELIAKEKLTALSETKVKDKEEPTNLMPVPKPPEVITVLKGQFNSVIEGESYYKGDTLVVDFPQSNFFNSGSHHLNTEGKRLVQEIQDKLAPYKNKLSVTVQGHTDPDRFKQNRSILSDNWELSVLRATSVIKVLIDSGFDPTYLAAEGFSDKNYKLNPNDDYRYMRKVTFKIRGYEK